MTGHGIDRQRSAGADVLTLGFGVAVAMWAVGYFTHLPTLRTPAPVVLVAMMVCLLLGGGLAGRCAPRGWRAGVYAGLVASLLNLLILGSLLNPSDQPNRVVPSAVLWVPGSILASALLGGLGGWLGERTRTDPAPVRNWTAAFASVAVAATLLLLVVGGMVTGYEEGLAVVDWPNSFGHNMFLYPLSRMTGGIYYEHAHRLIGSLVGLTTLVLAVHLARVEGRRWLRVLAFVALLMVIVQGVLGGLRVTGHFTLSTSRADVSPSITLAIVHGVLGQVFFATLVAIRVFLSDTWQSDRPAVSRLSAATDRGLGVVLVALLIGQLVLGAVLRHIAGGLLLHVSMAVVVTVAALASGARAWGLYPDQPVLVRLGRWVLVLIAVQVTLGIVALAMTGFTLRQGSPHTGDVIVTGLHQIVGALLLAVAVMLSLFVRRLLTPTVITVLPPRPTRPAGCVADGRPRPAEGGA